MWEKIKHIVNISYWLQEGQIGLQEKDHISTPGDKLCVDGSAKEGTFAGLLLNWNRLIQVFYWLNYSLDRDKSSYKGNGPPTVKATEED